MEWSEFEFGDSIAGLLIDGVDDMPYVGATFRIIDPQGVVVEIPYLAHHDADQFAHVAKWFSQQSPPKNMLMRTPEGTISMFDVAWSGHSETWGGDKSSLGKLRPNEVVFANREGPLADALEMAELHSYVDAATLWSRATAVTTDRETDEDGKVQGVTIHLAGGPVVSWNQGEATMELRSSWSHHPVRGPLATVTTLNDSVTLVSKFEAGSREFWDHFVEQRKFATLLVFVFGRPISFRRHQMRDDRFPTRGGREGTVMDLPLRELISRRTLGERSRQLPLGKDFDRPLVPFAAVGSEGLEAWSDAYDKWSRFIVPSAAILNRSGAFIEDVVLSTSMSLEAAGALLGKRDGEEVTRRGRAKTTATYVYRCLAELSLTWPGRIQTVVGLARAIADNYNDLKHADRGEFPDQVISYVISQTNRFVVRAIALSRTSSSDSLRESFQQSTELNGIAELLHLNGLSIDDDGHWTHDPENEEPATLPPGIQFGPNP
ncbi:hypothetical protein [Glaciihabitans sp. UYNi722]|uniref:hypothetical protein n=1 Tax=Glaciihabitans sp. UYNi722 TaxID=3156344 RepID=UPI003395CF16